MAAAQCAHTTIASVESVQIADVGEAAILPVVMAQELLADFVPRKICVDVGFKPESITAHKDACVNDLQVTVTYCPARTWAIPRSTRERAATASTLARRAWSVSTTCA